MICTLIESIFLDDVFQRLLFSLSLFLFRKSFLLDIRRPVDHISCLEFKLLCYSAESSQARNKTNLLILVFIKTDASFILLLSIKTRGENAVFFNLIFLCGTSGW